MPRMRPWKLCRFFADGGGVRHGGKGWCLREWIPHHAGRARGGSIAKRARFTHSMLLQGGAGRRPTRISALEKGDARGSTRSATERRRSRGLGAGRCAPLAPRLLPLKSQHQDRTHARTDTQRQTHQAQDTADTQTADTHTSESQPRPKHTQTAYGLMSSSIADWGQKGQREAQNSQD